MEDDNFLSKIIKYIPAEVIAVYTAIVGVLKQNLDSNLPERSAVNTYFIVLLIIVCLTPIWTYYAVIDNPNIKEPPSKKKRAIFHSIIATISFIIWVYAIGDILFKSWLCKCYSPETIGCFDKSGNYDSILGSIVLILYTGLLVPLLERIVLGKPSPTLGLLSATAQEIIDSCEANFEANKNDCSAFVKAVAIKFSVNLTGQADSIVDQIRGDGWTQLEHDRVKAKEKADNGWLVIAGLKAVDTVPTPPATTVTHGHVVVVVSGELDSSHEKYPTAYWGSSNGGGKKKETINWAWNTKSRDKVYYAAKQV